MGYIIKNITTERELDRAIAFDKQIFADSHHLETAEYSREKWLEHMKNYNDLMLYAEADKDVVGIVFGRAEENGSITVGPVATAPGFRRRGLAREMMFLLEKRALKHGIHRLALGAVQSAEGFYIKCGYTPFLFIQAKSPYNLKDMRTLNSKYREVLSYDDGADIRLMLATDGIDRELKNLYDITFPGCSTQTVFIKNI